MKSIHLVAASLLSVTLVACNNPPSPVAPTGAGIPSGGSALSYHVTRGDRNATSLVSAGSLRMLDGNVATISMVNGAAYIQNAKILTTDMRASNGVVHVIDAVILPPGI